MNRPTMEHRLYMVRGMWIQSFEAVPTVGIMDNDDSDDDVNLSATSRQERTRFVCYY